MSNNSFKFEVKSIDFYEKDNKKKCRIVCYCSYEFVTIFFVSDTIGHKIEEKLKSPNYDITNDIYIKYNKDTDKFSYFINLK